MRLRKFMKFQERLNPISSSLNLEQLYRERSNLIQFSLTRQ